MLSKTRQRPSGSTKGECRLPLSLVRQRRPMPPRMTSLQAELMSQRCDCEAAVTKRSQRTFVYSGLRWPGTAEPQSFVAPVTVAFTMHTHTHVDYFLCKVCIWFRFVLVLFRIASECCRMRESGTDSVKLAQPEAAVVIKRVRL